MSDSKELVAKKQEQAALVAEANDASSWGTTNVSSNDIIIPRLLLMQPMSEKVTAGDAAFGDFRESLNNEKLGDFTKGFEFVPFHMEKVFIEYDATDEADKKYIRVVPITPENEDAKYNDVGLNREGKQVPISRDRVMNFYVLLPSELEAGTAIPYIISARRTSIKAGKKLAMQMFVKNIQAGKTPASVICAASASKQSQDKKTWAVLDITPSKPTPNEFLVEALKWLKIIKAGKAKAHEESFNEDAREVVSEPGETLNEPTRF